jgi:hypothetical protein
MGELEAPPAGPFRGVLAHVFVAYSNHSIAGSCQELATCAVVGLLSSSVMRISLELDDDAFARAVKVNNETVQDVLPALRVNSPSSPLPQGEGPGGEDPIGGPGVRTGRGS